MKSSMHPEPYYGEVPELQGVWATGKPWKSAERNYKAL